MQTTVRGWIAYQIQALREKTGLTQQAFAERLGKKQSTISRLENSEYGKVTVQTLLDIACSLDVALQVRFVSYPDFLNSVMDSSVVAMQPATVYESLMVEPQVLREVQDGTALAQVSGTAQQSQSDNRSLVQLFGESGLWDAAGFGNAIGQGNIGALNSAIFATPRSAVN
nr:helix-turn-helix transcriptional regulator [Nitrobacter winogradskyi]